MATSVLCESDGAAFAEVNTIDTAAGSYDQKRPRDSVEERKASFERTPRTILQCLSEQAIEILAGCKLMVDLTAMKPWCCEVPDNDKMMNARKQ